MKTFKHLYPRICDFENIYKAYRAARKGKRNPVSHLYEARRAKRATQGMHESVAAFEYNQEAELLRLRDELRARAW